MKVLEMNKTNYVEEGETYTVPVISSVGEWITIINPSKINFSFNEGQIIKNVELLKETGIKTLICMIPNNFVVIQGTIDDSQWLI